MSEEDYVKGGTDLYALVAGRIPEEMTDAERDVAVEAATRFAKEIAAESPGPCLVITGQFVPPNFPVRTADAQVMECCLDAFGYQNDKEKEGGRTISVLLDSPGGSLDSAYKVVRYLTWYAGKLNIYVPRQAKSASTLLALAANCVYLSPFGELGPLDTQIPDPRNPTKFVSALDCYQSVDYVRQFGVATMSQALQKLGEDARSQIAFVDLLTAATAFGTGAIRPMLEGIKALDFGGWGRSLKIGEKYALQILKENKLPEPPMGPLRGKTPAQRAADISNRIVYDYTHHLHPIDMREVTDIGLAAKPMSEGAYNSAMAVLANCEGKSFIEFVSEEEWTRRQEKRQQRFVRLVEDQPRPAQT